MIKTIAKDFLIETDHTTLLLSHGRNEKLTIEYYGRKILSKEEIPSLKRNYPVLQGGECVLNEEDTFSNNMLKQAVSTLGNGDFFSPSVVVFPFPTLDFFFSETKEETEVLSPFPVPKDPDSSLVIELEDRVCSLLLRLHLLTYDKEDVIGAYYELVNRGENPVHVNKLMSFQLPLVDRRDTLLTTSGCWAEELTPSERRILPGRTLIESNVGSSSARHNPSFLIKEEGCSKSAGNCYGFHLVYSGNFEASVEMDAFDNLRIQLGILSTGFLKEVEKDASFFTPVAVFSYSGKGTNGLSHHLQSFVNAHVIPKSFQYRERPIVYNNWEATGMKFSKGKIVSLMKKAKDLGIELFVLDDGWFSSREDDRHGLGDWRVNEKKLPGGLVALSQEAERLGLKFGIWMEPEMVNEDTEVYRKHPEWILRDNHREYLGRHQHVLDLSMKEVQEFVLESVRNVLSSGKISYLKWDCNRNQTNLPALSKNYDYIIGLYQVLSKLTKEFPDVLFENCASGGNRFDLGMLSFFPQSWMSDDTDSFQRETIQSTAMFFYPLSVMSNHVACKTSNQLLRKISLETKFDVGMMGILGYELDLGDLSPIEEKTIKEQIVFYKKHRRTLQFGRAFHVQDQDEKKDLVLEAKSDKECIVLYFRAIDRITFPEERLMAVGLKEDGLYEYENRKEHIPLFRFGNLVNYVSPIHLKEDGMLLSLVSRYKDMMSEEEHGFATGGTLMSNGPILKQQWSGAGYNDQIRVMGDFSSRCYVIQKKKS